MAKDMFQIQLPSGRSVRYRVLAPSEIENAEKQAALESEKETSMVEFNAKTERFALLAMILAHSAPTEKGTLPVETAWQKAGTELVTGWDGVFSAKDCAVLKGVYRMEHVVTKDELDAVMAGKVPVLGD